MKIKLGTILFEQKKTIGKSDGDNLNLIGVSNDIGLHVSRAQRIPDLSRYKLIEKGWFAYNPMRVNVGSIGYAFEVDHIGIVSPDYVVFSCSEKIIPEYLLYLLKSDEGIEAINKNASGAVRKRLYFSNLANIEIVLPSLDTQRRRLIAFNKVQNLGRKIILQTSSDNLISQLKQSILQEAIQGKLTEDWRKLHPENETASELLKRIKAEKAKLIKEKKIKKENPLPPITKEEIPFELPEGWAWCRLGEITNYGSSEKAEPAQLTESTWVLDLEDIEKESSRIVQKKTFKERSSLSTKSVFKKGWVLYSKLRPYLDKVVIADEGGVCTTEILPLPVFSNMVPEFMMFGMKGRHFLNYVNSKVGGMKMPRLGTEDGKMAIIPIAPVEEQKAIVQKVETLMEKCRALEAEIAQSGQHAQMLMQAVLKEAFEPKPKATKSAGPAYQTKEKMNLAAEPEAN